MKKFIFSFALFNIMICQAQDGILDPSFGEGGKVITNVNNFDSQEAASIAISKDNKIAVTGWFNTRFDRDFVTLRYNNDGTLDSTYSDDGVTIDSFSVNDIGSSVAVQEDGKIVVAGYTYNGTDSDFAVLRYCIDGILDSTFNDNGFVRTPIGIGSDNGMAMSIQQDGKIVVAGHADNGSDFDFAVVRYNSDGSPDSSFNYDGVVVTPIGRGNDYVRSMSIQQDNKIVVAGHSDNGHDLDFAIIRYNTDGILDKTFNNNGIVTTPIDSGSVDKMRSVVIHNDGGIVIVGQSMGEFENNYVIVKYTTNGTVDNNFNKTGRIMIPCSICGISYDGAIDVQTDGKIIFGGSETNGDNFDFMLIRYDKSGKIDSTFGDNGVLISDLNNENNIVQALKVYDNRIIASGLSVPNDQSHFYVAVARYNIVITDIKEDSPRLLPSEYALQQNYPNPFNNQTTIIYQLGKPGKVNLSIYDISGQLVEVLEDGIKLPNIYRSTWDASRYASGNYFVRLFTGDYTSVRKMLLVK